MKVSTRQLVLSCEHGGNRIPAAYRHLFAGNESVLGTHRGLDIGALATARAISSSLGAPLVLAEISRLLVDLNRSPHHRNLFSAYTRACSEQMQQTILQDYYYPYRQRLEQLIRERCRYKQPVLHLSIHSFTPKLGRQLRNADIGLLYDPARKSERDFCLQLQALLTASGLRTRRNYPYRGNADGMTTFLRRVLPATAYLGIEIEINQKLVSKTDNNVGKLLTNTIKALAIR